MHETHKSFTFPQAQRLKTTAEFQRVYDRKRSASDGLLVVYVCENELGHPRVGLSVSKKVGNAVARNRCKRLFREAFRFAQHELPQHVDLIMIPRSVTIEPTVEMLSASLLKLAHDAARKLKQSNAPRGGKA